MKTKKAHDKTMN